MKSEEKLLKIKAVYDKYSDYLIKHIGIVSGVSPDYSYGRNLYGYTWEQSEDAAWLMFCNLNEFFKEVSDVLEEGEPA